MIIISINGGLGNQMFEYAFYEMIKLKYPTQKVKIEIMHTRGRDHNGYEIEKVFGLRADEASINELKQLSDYYPLDAPHYVFWNFIYKIRKKIFGSKKSFIVQKDGTEYEEKFFSLEADKSYYLLGVFANYRYFIEIEDYIKALYSFPQIVDEENKILEREIESSNSVGIHIRRGDYFAWGVKTLSEEYYRDAIKIMEEKIGKCRYFVFTDDPAYVKETYKDIENLKIVEGNIGENSFRDMQLMSLCKHNIVANSTFSFWGAFLNRNRNKVVIASKEPFTGCKYPFSCDGWILL